MIDTQLEEKQWLTRFVSLLLAAFLGVFVVDILVSWKTKLLSDDMRNSLFELIKNVVLVVFGYQFNNKKEITSDDVKLGIDTLYKKKLEDWTKSQSSIGNNTKPGEGTRRRLEKDSEIELFKLLKGDNVNVVTTYTQPETDVETDQNELQESLKRIKTLLFF